MLCGALLTNVLSFILLFSYFSLLFAFNIISYIIQIIVLLCIECY